VSVPQAARGKLDLGGIGMTVVPLEVFKQFDLKALWLHENSIQEIPPEIADLTALTQLRVNNNELRVLPAAVSELKALQVLWLQHNSLAAFPPEILALTNLTALSVSSNPLLYIPHQLCAITSLRDLHVEGEQLTSPPPKVAARGTSAIMECVAPLPHRTISNCNTLHMYLRKVEQGFSCGSVVLQKENLEAFPVDVGVMHGVVAVNLSNNFIATVSPAAMHMCARRRPRRSFPALCFTLSSCTLAAPSSSKTTKSRSCRVKSAD
jgi:hypothetical protein